MNVQATKKELINLVSKLRSEELLQKIKQFVAQLDLEKDANDMAENSIGFSKKESELMIKINKGLPQEMHVRYQELLQKSVEENLKDKEQEELLNLSNKFEQKTAERLKDVYELSLLWNTTVDDVMNQLGLNPPPIIHG